MEKLNDYIFVWLAIRVAKIVQIGTSCGVAGFYTAQLSLGFQI